MGSRLLQNTGQLLKVTLWRGQLNSFSIGSSKRVNGAMIDLPDDLNTRLPIPPYEERIGEPIELKKARLLYQSRKRGMLENGLILSTFAAKYLANMNFEQVREYDRLINLPSNDWDIYYWATGVKDTPVDFDNETMNLLKEHVQNKDRETRSRQPDLDSAVPTQNLFK